MTMLSDDVLGKILDQQRVHGLQHFGSKLSDYEVLGHLGRGATAYVYRVRARKSESPSSDDQNQESEKQYALKVIDKEQIKKKNLEQRVKNEIEIQILLNNTKTSENGRIISKNELLYDPIVFLYHCFEDESNIYMLMEHCEGQELYQMIR